MSAHSFISPSSLPRVALCPGSLLASIQSPRSRSGAAAERGTALHEEAEKILRDHDFSWPPPTSMSPEISTYVFFCYALIKQADRYGIEEKVSLDSFSPIGDQKGSCDFWALVGDILWVTDYKSGSGIVHADSEQLLAYAMGIYHDKLTASARAKIREVRTVIVQVNQIEEHGRSIEEFNRDGKYLAEVCLRALSPNPTFAPSDKACEWCPAAGICKARADQLAGITSLEPEQAALLPLEQAEAIFSFKSKVDKYFKQVEALLTSAALEGKELAHFELGRTRPHRTWQGTTEELMEAFSKRGLSPLAFMEMTSPAKVEKQLGAKVWKATVADLAYQPEGEVKLVQKKIL